VPLTARLCRLQNDGDGAEAASWATPPSSVLGEDRPSPEDSADAATGRVHTPAGVIVTGSLLRSARKGIVTATTPSLLLALIFEASTPAGSAIERMNDPYRRARRR